MWNRSIQRDLVGYGRRRPRFRWPGDATVAVTFVINYEEGSEYSIAVGDEQGEFYGLSYPFPSDKRNLRLESEFEYGSRVGIWRLLDLFHHSDVPLTIHASAVAMAANQEVAAAIRQEGHEVCAHGWRWEEAWRLSEDEEREHISLAYNSLATTCSAPVGWYSRYGPSENTRRLVVEHGGFIYDSDAYNDDLPYTERLGSRHHIVLPYSAIYNDSRLASGAISDPDGFLTLLERALEYYSSEGDTSPRLMSIGLHPRIMGHAARAAVLRDFLQHCRRAGTVWLARRRDVAEYWRDISELEREEHSE